MDNAEDNMNVDKIKFENNPPEKGKPKKRSLVERELETSLTSHVTSPLNNGEGTSTSRYGRARRVKTDKDFCDTEKTVTNILKSPQNEKSPNENSQSSSPVYKMQAANSLIHENSPKKVIESNLENQIENIYNTNISLSRFGSEEKNKQSQSSAKKISKVYMRKDLIQSKEKDDPIVMIKSIFSPSRSGIKSNSHLSNVLERSSDKYDLCKTQNGYLDTSSVVKTLDFDCSKKKKKDNKETKNSKETKTMLSKSDLFDIEAKCAYQVGDIAWARMGTFPFWPCIVTREPGSDMFVRKKLFGKIERDIVHVTFFGDNGRRSWIVDSMLRKYQGLDEFENARDQFTPEAKKKDSKLYAAFFISDKKLALWHTAIEEADYIQREPKRLRIDLLNELLGYNTQNTPLKNQKSSKVTRTDSDVSLSESLYDSLFSEVDVKADESRPKKNKSLDVSEVVTACLDNMAAKTGFTMIQRQSHMDIWLQKAKSKTPEKSQVNVNITVERLDGDNRKSKSKERDNNNSNKKKKKNLPPRDDLIQKPYSFRKSTESQHLLSYQNEHDYSKNGSIDSSNKADDEPIIQCDSSICVIDKVESLRNSESANEEQDFTTAEVHEETIIARDIQNEASTADTYRKNDTSSAFSTAMDINFVHKEMEKSPIENSEDANLKSYSNSKPLNIKINKEVANKNTDVIGPETYKHVATSPILKVQPNSLKTDDKDDSKENKDKNTTTSVSLSNKVTNMSIDEDSICQENVNTEQNQNEISKENVQQSGQFQERQNDIQQNEVNVDINMSLDANVTSFENNHSKSKVQIKTIVSNKEGLHNALPINVPESKFNSSIKQQYNDDVTDPVVSNQNSANHTVNNIDAVSKNKEITLQNEDSIVAGTSMENPSHQVLEVNKLKMVPKITLTVIKEANNKLFKITSPKIKQSKRRSLRRMKNKRDDFLPMTEPEFLQYLEMKQDAIMDEHPELKQNEIIEYLYNTWLFGNNAALKRCSGIRKSKSPTDFTAEALDDNIKSDDTLQESKEPDAKLTETKEDKGKEAEKLLSVKPNSDCRSTLKRSLRLRKSQSPSFPEKHSEHKVNIVLDALNLEEESNMSLKQNNLEYKRDSYEHAASSTIDSNTVTSKPHASPSNNVSKSEDNTKIAEKENPKDIYIVTPKKRSLCLRISKKHVEPKVVLERKEFINNLKETYKIDVAISQVGTSKASDPKLPVNDELKFKTNTAESCQSELDKTRSSRRLRKSKSSLESEDNQEKKIPFTDDSVSNLSAADTGICNKIALEIIPVVSSCHVTKGVEIESPRCKIRCNEQLEPNEKQPETNDEPQSEREIKRSSIKIRQSKPSIEIAVSEDKLENLILTADKLDSKGKEGNAQEHIKIVTENVIPTIKDILSETGAKLELPLSKKCSNKQQELKECGFKMYDELEAASELETFSNKLGKSKASIETAASEEKQENKTPNADELTCKLIVEDKQAHNKIANDNVNLAINHISSNAELEVIVSQKRSIEPELKERDFITKSEFKISSESKRSLNRLRESKSYLEDTASDDQQEDVIPVEHELDCKPVDVSSKANDIMTTKNIAPVIESDQYETDSELEVSLSKRRSLRLRRTQSTSLKHLVREKQESANDVLAADVAEAKKDNTINLPSDEIESVISNSQNESSKIINNPVKCIDINEEDDKIYFAPKSVDNISLASYFTNGIVDHSSDKDFDPDTVSINSLSSEISDVSVVPRKAKTSQDKSNMFQKLLDSDNDSMSSLDNLTLSDLKMRSSKEIMTVNLRHSIENSMDSIKSDTSERRLRLVLTDCILDARSNKLPVIKEVSSKTDAEFEISQSHSDISISKNRSSHISKHSEEPKVNGFQDSKPPSPEPSIGTESMKTEEPIQDPDTISIKSSASEASIKRRGKNKSEHKPMEEPEFLQYFEMRQDALMDEHPEVTPDELVAYLYKTWQYEESLKSDIKKNDEIESSNLVKGVNAVTQELPKKKKVMKQKKLINIEKILAKSPKADHFIIAKDELRERELPRRKASKPFYKEDYSDIEEEIEMFEIFKTNKKPIAPKTENLKEATFPDTSGIKLESEKISDGAALVKTEAKTSEAKEVTIDLDEEEHAIENYYNDEDLYFEELESFLTNPKPNVFKGLIREKVCEICEKTANLVKCKGCSGMFHIECVKKEDEIVDIPAPTRGRKKKKKPRGRKPKSSLDSNEESHSDEKSQDLNVSEENMSIEEVKDPEPIVIPDAENFESQLEAKMKEIIETVDKIEYDSYTSDDGIDWSESVAGKCEIVDVKLKSRPQSVNTDDFKCKNCQNDDTPICFVCKSPVSPKNKVERRQKCQVAHCHKYYHLDCLDHWPQTQFNAGEPSRSNKKIDEHFEAMACPRHVCHTCVSDDPRGCKTRFSGDKLARCVRCPATYHSFTKCLPAGSQILSASHIVCPRHYEHRPGKIPYHVNTGWCFICALGGNLICCDYCPTSFHADCLNIEPPEGGYMCEDCETGRLPLYGEMVWVKLGHYRWWPGIVLHPAEIPDNIMAVKHSPGEFVVRFFGQYDHYWVNRGRVFPFQEGDSGKISTQKSKIDEAFTKAMEHAQRAFEILKNIEPNDDENHDIQSSLLPPHYVKLKVNKPCGALYGRKVDIEESSLTQCECNPDEEDPCGPYSHCLNRMLLTECGPICRAGERCQNRAFEKRLYPKLVPYRTPHRGWGLRTLEPIKAGQFVIEYVGELIDEAEFRRRMQRKHETRDENFYFLTLDKERLIDAGPKGNLARFMNHCCEPNCETQKWTVLGDVRVGLFALYDIPANTEVTFNYNLECTGIDKKRCMCGARRCAGYIGAKPKQEDPQPKKLKAAKRTYKKRKNTCESPNAHSHTHKPRRPVGRPAKPRELTDIEKDLLIIKNATSGLSSDSECSRLSSGDVNNTDADKREAKALKRKRVSFSTEEIVPSNGNGPSVKRPKLDENEKSSEVGD